MGQNVAGGYRTWEAAIGGWHDEVKMYVFGREPDSYLGKGGWLKIGHYTQVGIDKHREKKNLKREWLLAF